MSHAGNELRTDSDDILIRAIDAERLVAAVMYGAMAGGTTASRIRATFERVQPLFGSDAEFQIYLGIRLDRKPAPLLLDRIWFGEVYDRIEPRPIGSIQSMVDTYCSAIQLRIDRARRSREHPCTCVVADLYEPEKFETEVRQKILAPLGFANAIISDWISSKDRMLTLHVLRKTDEPFTLMQCRLTTMLMQALAPIMDHHVAQREPSILSRLSRKQLRTLEMILVGSPDRADPDVVSRLLSLFDVHSTDELMSLFVDRSQLEEVQELQRLFDLE